MPPDLRLVPPSAPAPLPSGGGGGTYDGMEARVARLEEDVREIKTDLRAIRTDVQGLKVDSARIDERLKHLPSFNQMLTVLLLMLGILGSVTLFQDRIKAAVGLAPPPPANALPR